jgi:hypothetical protein
VYFITSFKILSGPADFPLFKKNNEQENIPEILKDESIIIEHFKKQGNHSHFNFNFKK